MERSTIQKINDYLWEIPKSYRPDMRVPARFYADENILEATLGDRSLDQLVNVATLPGIQKYSLAMPDIHEGYGFPVGGVAAMDTETGVISPGGIGYDICCGVRLLVSQASFDEVQPKLADLTTQIQRDVPSGLGRGGRIELSGVAMDHVLKEGARNMVQQGYGSEEDLRHAEANGNLENADPAAVSDHAKRRGRDQLGTIGSGNHFIEIDRVEEVFAPELVEGWKMRKDQVVILIHTGSRGVGHQIATDYIRTFLGVMPKYGIELPDRELAAAPFTSPEGQQYFSAMAAGANFAWANRQFITHQIREAWKRVLGEVGVPLTVLYDVAHNIAKFEEYAIETSDKRQVTRGKRQATRRLIVHRKGATRAFGPGNKELPEDFQNTGQPVLIPGSMGTASYVLVGTAQAMEEAFGSSCHGAGRRLSRHAAKREVRGSDLKQQLEKEGIVVRAGSMSGLAEEAPLAYKDVDSVVKVVEAAGIAKRVVRLKPIGVIKG